LQVVIFLKWSVILLWVLRFILYVSYWNFWFRIHFKFCDRHGLRAFTLLTNVSFKISYFLAIFCAILSISYFQCFIRLNCMVTIFLSIIYYRLWTSYLKVIKFYFNTSYWWISYGSLLEASAVAYYACDIVCSRLCSSSSCNYVNWYVVCVRWIFEFLPGWQNRCHSNVTITCVCVQVRTLSPLCVILYTHTPAYWKYLYLSLWTVICCSKH
jgi:hypothetical protein